MDSPPSNRAYTSRTKDLGIRLENNILVQKGGNVDLMASIPIEGEEIEGLMSQSKGSSSSTSSKVRGTTPRGNRNGIRSTNGALERRKSRTAKVSL